MSNHRVSKLEQEKLEWLLINKGHINFVRKKTHYRFMYRPYFYPFPVTQ